ncbi:hypothetical protein LTR15_000445 [Elasticomyces elasticus]|nr:hypothetical protein LTR15_000445 [Elasticomyces elasticus]
MPLISKRSSQALIHVGGAMASSQTGVYSPLQCWDVNIAQDRRHLLSDSVAPSSAASIVTDISDGDGDRTPRAHSPAPSYRLTDERYRIPSSQRRDTIADPTTIPQPYKGFPSEAHYLAALHAWAEGKKYIEPTETSLYGFFGHTSLQEYASKPPLETGLRRKWRARKEAKKEQKQEQAQKIAAGRRNTVT